MNKTDLINAVANSAELSKARAGTIVDTVLDAITDALKEGNDVTLIGFGTFSVRERAGRSGRNPRTGQPLEIQPAKIPGFKAGKALRDAVK